MAVPEDMLGPWVLVAQKIRFTKDAPPRQDRVVERPRHPKTGAFLDLDERTTVTFEPDDAVDVPQLLRSGVIQTPSTALSTADLAIVINGAAQTRGGRRGKTTG